MRRWNFEMSIASRGLVGKSALRFYLGEHILFDLIPEPRRLYEALRTLPAYRD